MRAGVTPKRPSRTLVEASNAFWSWRTLADEAARSTRFELRDRELRRECDRDRERLGFGGSILEPLLSETRS